MKAKKKYGQHFLINKGVQQKIVDAIKEHVPFGSNMLEVGPGQGVLTQYLIKEDYNLKIVEIDADMLAIVRDSYPEIKDDQVIFSDILRIDITQIFDGEPFVMVGNFPYNISSQLMIRMWENHTLIPTMVGMFQKEVADRVISKPGSKTYGITSVFLQSYYDCKRLFNVAPGSFSPPPRVDSSVISLTRNTVEQLPCDQKQFKKVVKHAFQQRRKMLRNTLKPLAKEDFNFGNEIFTKRPEQLNIQDFIDVTTLIYDK